MTCAECRFAVAQITDPPEEPVLKCHRYPPRLLVVDEDVVQAQPDANARCGEFQEETDA